MVKTKEIDMADVATKIVNLLKPLNSEQRQRVVEAALTLVGEAPARLQQKAGGETDISIKGGENLQARVQTWMRQNALTFEQLQQVFHTQDGNTEVIASAIPGANDKEQTLNGYVLRGVSCFITSGSPNFDDKSARGLCNTLGCYDPGNHATYLKGRGNLFAGSKEKGWTLTAPGLAKGAALVKEITKETK